MENQMLPPLSQKINSCALPAEAPSATAQMPVPYLLKHLVPLLRGPSTGLNNLRRAVAICC